MEQMRSTTHTHAFFGSGTVQAGWRIMTTCAMLQCVGDRPTPQRLWFREERGTPGSKPGRCTW